MPSSKTASERRQSERRYQHGHAEVLRDGGEAPLSIQVMNISDGGVRFVVSEPFSDGEEFTVILSDRKYHCRALHCKELFKGFAIRSQYVEND